METKINIAAILKDKPKRTKLYTDTFGELSIENIDVENELGIILSSKDDDELLFYNDGRYNLYGEPILVPSKSMRDWRKFAWKKGDVLVHKDGTVHIIFEGFEDDTYRTFKGKYYLWEYNGHIEQFDDHQHCMETSVFIKANDDDTQTYINTIEKNLGGKLNRETLEVEKAQPEFKDGDIVYADYGHKQAVFIVSGKTDLSEGYNSFIALDLRYLTLDMGGCMSFFKKDICKLRLATEEEKKQLFQALEKEGKRWDSEKKEVVDLKPKVEQKPFDKVLVRDSKSDNWRANLFGYIGKDEYYHCVFANWVYCIPYNEETAHLLGTTDEWKGGER